jgi:hypothetical protein
MEQQFPISVIDAITIYLEPVRSLLCELEKNAPDEQLSIHWAAVILLQCATDEIVKTMKAIEDRIGKIELVQHSNPNQTFHQISDVIFTPANGVGD